MSLGFRMCENILKNPMVFDMMLNDSFDLIIIDIFFSESLLGFAQHFGAPVIGISSIGWKTIIDGLVGNTTPLSYVTNNAMTHLHSQNMNFWRRSLNVAMSALQWLHYNYEFVPAHKELYKRYFPNATVDMEDILKNFSLILSNDHFTISTPKPYVPNVIEIAGLHIPEQPEPLPEDIRQLLNTATQGVIYVKVDSLLPDHIIQMILNQFEKLKLTVLWNCKCQPSSSWQIPANVHFYSTTAHHSILGHRDIHLYICNGGYLSVIDSLHYGIPILGIPNAHGNLEEYFDFIAKIDTGITLKPIQMKANSFEDIARRPKINRNNFVIS